MNDSPSWYQDPDNLPRGIFFAPFIQAFVAIGLFLSVLYGLDDLTVFSLILILLALGLKAWSSFSSKALHYQVAIDKRKVFPGESIDFQVVIENRKLLPVLVKIRLALDASLVPDNRQLLIRDDSVALWYQKLAFHHQMRPVKRGVYSTGAPRLITGDIFGFFPNITREKQATDILVYPRVIPLKPFTVINSIMFGKSALSSPVCDPVFILGTRDYRSFSSARHIHWKASARHNKLQEKVFEATEQEKLLFVLEAEGFVDGADEQGFERAIEALASLALVFDAHHFAVGFLTNCSVKGLGSNFLPVLRNPNHLSSLFEIFAKIERKSSCRLATLLQEKPFFPQGANCVIVTYRPLTGELPFIPAGCARINLSYLTPGTTTLGPFKHIALQNLVIPGWYDAN